MPIRFSTEAANADKLNDDRKPDGISDGMTEADHDGTSRGKAGGKPEREQKSDETQPGKDINAPGFVQDKDAGKP